MLFPHVILRETRSMAYISWADRIALVNMTRSPFYDEEELRAEEARYRKRKKQKERDHATDS